MNGDWFYTNFGAMSHYRRSTADDGFDPVSDCGIGDDLWFGHGSPEEIEHLAGLKPCRMCKDRSRLP